MSVLKASLPLRLLLLGTVATVLRATPGPGAVVLQYLDASLRDHDPSVAYSLLSSTIREEISLDQYLQQEDLLSAMVDATSGSLKNDLAAQVAGVVQDRSTYDVLHTNRTTDHARVTIRFSTPDAEWISRSLLQDILQQPQRATTRAPDQILQFLEGKLLEAPRKEYDQVYDLVIEEGAWRIEIDFALHEQLAVIFRSVHGSLQSDEPEQALGLIQQLLVLDPGNPEGQRLERSIREARELQSELAEIQELIEAGDLERARTRLATLAKRLDLDPSTRALVQHLGTLLR